MMEESLAPANNIVVFIFARMLKAQITDSRKIAWLYWKGYCYGSSDKRILVHFELRLNGYTKMRALKSARFSSP